MKILEKYADNILTHKDFRKRSLLDAIDGAGTISVTNDPEWQEGKYGSAIGSWINGYLTDISFPDVPDSGTLFVFCDFIDPVHYIFGAQDGGGGNRLYFQYASANKLAGGFGALAAGSIVGTTVIKPHSTHLIAFTWDTDYIRLYLDGNLENTQARGSNTPAATDPAIGTVTTVPTDRYTAPIYSYGMLNQVLTSEELSQLSNDLKQVQTVAEIPHRNFSVPVTIENYDQVVADWRMDIENGEIVEWANEINLQRINCPMPVWGRGKVAIEFNDNDSYLKREIDDFRIDDDKGSVSIRFKLNSLGSFQTLFASSSESTDNYFLVFAITSANKLEIRQFNNDGTVDNVVGDTILQADMWYRAVFSSDGSAYKIHLDSEEETLTVSTGTNSGDWFADTSNRVNITSGAWQRSSLVTQSDGAIDLITIRNEQMTDAEILEEYENDATLIYQNDFRNLKPTLSGYEYSQQDLIFKRGSLINGEDEIGKHITTDTSTSVAIVSNQFLGSWYAKLYHDTGATDTFSVMSDKDDYTVTVANDGYFMGTNTNERIDFRRIDNGSSNPRFSTLDNYIEADSVVEFFLTRDKNYSWTGYIRGAGFDEWHMVVPTLRTNPTTEASYKNIANFMILLFGDGTKIYDVRAWDQAIDPTVKDPIT